MTHRRLFYCHLHAFHYQLIDPITGTKEKKKTWNDTQSGRYCFVEYRILCSNTRKTIFFCGLRDLLPC